MHLGPGWGVTQGVKTSHLLAVSVVALLWVLPGCSPATPKCDATTCAGGCCDAAGQCQPGFAPTACGTGGNLCTTCFSGQACNLGLCQTTGFGGGTGTGGGGGGGGGGVGGGGGSVGPLVCATGRTACAGSCVDLTTDGRNCGNCGTLCTSSQFCSGGSCAQLPPDCSAAGCPTGFFCSGTQCKRGCATNTDCPQPGVCDARTAACSCAAGTHPCGNTCEPDTSVSACGPSCASCEGIDNAAPACSNSACDFTCNTGFHRCGNECKSDTDVGSCGSNCVPCQAPANGTSVCSNRQCDFVCNSGFHRCGDQCVSNTATATCGTACSPCQPPANGTATCNGISCDFTCNSGYHRCGNTCVSNTSTASCGTSCTPCAPPANSTATCNGTSCGFSCNTGTHACSGACVSNTSVNSCGTSSCTPCSPPLNAVATCNGTSCDFQCNTGYHRCGTSCRLDSDVNYCGSSCTICPTGPTNSTRTCTSGTCSFTCNTGYHLCNGQCVSDVSITQCGASCTTCTPPANGAAVCSSGSCDFVCNTGYHRCGSQCVSNTSVDSCGTTSCTPCPAGPPNSVPTCNGTSCGFTCNMGFNVCGGQCVGDDYVSACGSSCTACTVSATAEKPTCTAGTCGTACITSCNMACVDAQRDPANCGTCGAACGTGEACTGGRCRPTCANGAIAFEGVLPSVVSLGGVTGFRIAVGDLNNDGLVDFVDNGSSTGLNVRLASASGGLGLPTAYSLGVRANGLLIVDLDGDGWRDIVATRASTSSQLAIIKNNMGTLAAPTFHAMSTVTPSPAVFVLDRDGDGRLDVLVPGTGSTTYVFTQSTTGTFPASSSTTITTGLTNPQHSDVGDLDKDGRTDFAVATTTQYNVMRQLTQGAFTALGATSATGIGSVRVADVTGDTNLDLVLRSSTVGLVVPGTGAGAFSTAISVPLAGSGNVLPVDLNADGNLDLVTGGYAEVNVALATAPGVWGTPRPWPVPMPDPASIIQVGAGQHVGSAAPELFAAAATSLSLLINDGAGQFPTSRVTTGSSGQYLLSLGDFDGDGDQDCLRYDFSSSATISASLLTGNNTGLFTASGQTVSIRSSELVVGRLNGDLADDFITPAGLSVPAGIDVYLSTTPGSFAPRTTLTASTTVRRVYLANVDGDAHLDVVAITTQGVEWFKSNGNGTFGARATALTIGTSPTVEAIALGDLNLDGRPDLVVKTGGTSGQLRVYPAIIPGGFATAPLGATPAITAAGRDLFVADLDSDGRPDVLVHTGTSVALYKGNGNGTVGTTALNAFSASFTRVRLGDVNNDGRLDLVASPSGVVIYSGLSSGSWFGPSRFGVGPYIYEDTIALADVNNDGRLDVVLSADPEDVHVLLGTCRAP